MDDLEKEKEAAKNPEEESAVPEPEVSGEPGDQVEDGETSALEESATGLEEELDEEELEEEEFDLESQIEVFRQQIEEEPENCLHYYNLGEALAELGEPEEARAQYQYALKHNPEGDFSAIIHFGLGDLLYKGLIQGVSSNVLKSSVGLISSHKDKTTINEVNDQEYSQAVEALEAAIRDLPHLKADQEIVDYVTKNAPAQIANIYYKWASDLMDKARQLNEYGDEIKDVQIALKYLRRTLEVEPNHSAAHLMVKLSKKMLAEGWQSFDEYGFEAKNITGSG